jgi:hypothetical protein
VQRPQDTGRFSLFKPLKDKSERKEFYKKSRTREFNSNPRILTGQDPPDYVWMGRGKTTLPGSRIEIRVPVFFCTHDDAPHRSNKSKTCAYHIAAKLGLPNWLKYEDTDTKKEDGIAILRYEPDRLDRFFRPTILDALDHTAFRPGPPDSQANQMFRYGMTRAFEQNELCWENPTPSNRPGVKEVVMKNRQKEFPSNGLTLVDVVFYE